MTVDELETFVCIAGVGGFTEASRRLHRSQPAVSRRIHELERGLGAPLLERAGRRVTRHRRRPRPAAVRRSRARRDPRQEILAARIALARPEIDEMLDSVREPLTFGRFWDNLVHAVGRSRLRFDPHPIDAQFGR